MKIFKKPLPAELKQYSVILNDRTDEELELLRATSKLIELICNRQIDINIPIEYTKLAARIRCKPVILMSVLNKIGFCTIVAEK